MENIITLLVFETLFLGFTRHFPANVAVEGANIVCPNWGYEYYTVNLVQNDPRSHAPGYFLISVTTENGLIDGSTPSKDYKIYRNIVNHQAKAGLSIPIIWNKNLPLALHNNSNNKPKEGTIKVNAWYVSGVTQTLTGEYVLEGITQNKLETCYQQ